MKWLQKASGFTKAFADNLKIVDDWNFGAPYWQTWLGMRHERGNY